VVAVGSRGQILRQLRSAGRKKTGFKRRRKASKRDQSPNSGAQRGISRSFPESKLVELRNVSVRYGKAFIIAGVNWTVWAGESWALLGPNGSGKTTLLSLILGDNPQVYANRVTVFGKPRGMGESVWEIKRHIGWVSPELHLHFDDSAACLEVVASGFHDTIGLFDPMSSKQRATARRRLEQLKLLEFANAPLSSLSAGVQRVVLLARALVKNPRLLILDEPCQGLDQAHRELLIGTVDALVRAGSVTAIYVTHRDDEIPPSIRRVLRLSGGRATSERQQRWGVNSNPTKKPASWTCGQSQSGRNSMRRCRQ